MTCIETILFSRRQIKMDNAINNKQLTLFYELLRKSALRFWHSKLKRVTTWLIEGNGYETHQSSLLHVIVLFFGLDSAQNTIVVYSVPRHWPIETCWLRNSCIVYECKTKDCAGSWTFQHKSWHLYWFLWCLPGFLPVPSINYGYKHH